MNLFFKVLTVLCFVFGAQALDSCVIHKPEPQNDTLLICTDTSTTIGYCCQGIYDDEVHCCWYTPVWYLWYFWTPLVLFCFFVGLCMCLCQSVTSCCTKEDEAVTGQQTTYTVDVERQNIAPQHVAYQANQAQLHFQSNLPPTYAEVQHSQEAALNQYQEKPSGGAVNHSSSSSSSSSDEE